MTIMLDSALQRTRAIAQGIAPIAPSPRTATFDSLCQEPLMGAAMPPIPKGNGQHPVIMVSIAANALDASVAFYRTIFNWPIASVGADLAAATPAAGPMVTFRAGLPSGYQGAVPFIGVDIVEQALAQMVQGGGAIERAPWTAPMLGTLARFSDPAGTMYGLAQLTSGAVPPHIPAPFGDAPRPPHGALCSLEMHAGDLDRAAHFFGTEFGWGTLPTMPQYCMFDPGAGIGGVFQSHTPVARGLAYIYANDVSATLTAIEAAGGRAMGEPMAMPGMATFGYFTDPSGTALGLIGL
jgi:predicted enzyme related to lactoylglutathione lyase